MKLSLILALTRKGVIGKNGSLPWTLPSDLKRFREITLGHTIIMGRKTFESIGRPLPQRRNIVISRQENLALSGCEVFTSLKSAFDTCANESEVFVIGGAELIKSCWKCADKLYLTWIDEDFDGDVVLEDFSVENFKEIFEERHEAPFAHVFANYVKE
jgi:dihydrofolate reductase